MASTAPQRISASNVTVLRWAQADSELLELVQQGDPRAPSRVFDRFEADVNRIVWRCLGADPEHDDIVHEVFIAVLQGMHRVRRSASLRSWVLSVAVNVSRSELRRRRTRRRYGSRDEPPEVADPGVDPEARATLAKVYAILDRFPADERIAFVLRFVEQHALDDVAEMIGCSLATAKRRIAKASRRFEKLAGRDPDLGRRLADSPRWRDA